VPEQILPVLRHREMQVELRALQRNDQGEARAVENALHKLEAEGAALPYPWSTAVKSSPLRGLRELRPRGGHSRVRVFYVRDGGHFIVLGLAPEAADDSRRFHRAARRAAERFEALTTD
jgi:hypothetical protein